MEELKLCPLCDCEKISLYITVPDFFLSRKEFRIVQCEGCKLKFVNPRPSLEEIGSYYMSDDYISHDSEKSDLFSRGYRLARKFAIRNKFEMINKRINPGKLLDIGCGTGEFLEYCQGKGVEVFGYEPNSKARTHAILKNKLDVKDSMAKFHSVQNTFQCVTMWHVLEHVHNLNETIEEIKTLLIPGGLFLAAVPNCNSWDARHYKKFWAAYDVPRHLLHFTEVSMKALAQKHNLELVEILPQKLDAYYVSLLSEKYSKGRFVFPMAFINGLISNFRAGNHDFGHSSLIFMMRTKIS